MNRLKSITIAQRIALMIILGGTAGCTHYREVNWSPGMPPVCGISVPETDPECMNKAPPQKPIETPKNTK